MYKLKKIFSIILMFLFCVNLNFVYATVAKPKIIAVANIYKNIYQGEYYTLPKSVNVRMSNNTNKYIPITWKVKTIDTTKLAKYTYWGSVKGYAKSVMLSLTINPFYLHDLKYYDIKGKSFNFDSWKSGWTESKISVNGKIYTKGIGSGYLDKTTGQNSWIEYKLNYNYKQLNFKLGINDTTAGTAAKGGIIIYDENNNILYQTQQLLEAQDEPINVNVNVTGVKMIKIEFIQPLTNSQESSNFCADVVLLNPVLVR